MQPNRPTATHWWWPRSPMQRRFAATFVASVVAPMAIMATVLVWLVHADARRNVHEHLADLADQKQVQLEQHFDVLRRNASALARQKMIRRFLRHSADGTPDPRFAPPVFDLLHGYQEAHWGMFHHVMLALPNGNVVLSPPHGSATHAHESQDLSALPEFAAAKAGPVATGFFGFEETDHYHQLYLQPVKSGDECLGVLVFEIEIDHIRQMLGDGFDPDSGTWASLLTLDGIEVVKLKTERQPALRFDLLQRATEAPGLYVGEYDGHSGRPVLGACYRAGDWPWVLALELDRARAFAHANDLKGISSILGGLCALLILFIGLRMASQYARPLITIASEAEALATGDLTSPIRITGHGEVRDAHAALEHVRTSWRTVAAGIRDRATDLASAARQLHSTASELKTGVEATTQRTYTISAASEQMSATMSNVSDSGSGVAQRTADCMTTVADMESGMVELENRAAAANAVAERMAAFASQNSARVAELDTATNEVSKVTDLIRDIAEQTNLLALNATIEAARAGESGRGFAVVANEVKNLALQTAKASGEIIEQIQDIKTSTGAAVEVIDGVGTVAGEIRSTFRAMEQEIQEQVTAARGVLNLMRQTASEVGQLSSRVFESSATSGEVARSIGEIVGTARETSEGADNTAAASEHLTRLADELAGLASGFRT